MSITTNLEKKFRNIEPYVPGEQPQYADRIKLNTNENPYPPSPQVEKVLNGYNIDNLKMYPDPNVNYLRQALADYYGFNKEQVFVGVGSDDVLAMCFMAFFNSDLPIIFPDITYSFYPVWCELLKIPSKTYAVDEDLPYGHGEKSVYILSGFMKLTRDEAFAIRYHMGFSGEENKTTVGNALEMFPLAFALYVADMEATFIMEERLGKNEN